MWIFLMFFSFFKLEFTPCKAECEWPLKGIQLQETQEQKGEMYLGKLLKQNPKKEGAYQI